MTSKLFLGGKTDPFAEGTKDGIVIRMEILQVSDVLGDSLKRSIIIMFFNPSFASNYFQSRTSVFKHGSTAQSVETLDQSFLSIKIKNYCYKWFLIPEFYHF